MIVWWIEISGPLKISPEDIKSVLVVEIIVIVFSSMNAKIFSRLSKIVFQDFEKLKIKREKILDFKSDVAIVESYNDTGQFVKAKWR